MPFPNPETQFTKGQSGNPLGRPRKGFITDEAVEFLLEEHPRRPGKTRKRVLAEQWVKRAAKEQKAFDSLVDRIEGKPTETQEIDLKTDVNMAPRVVLPAGRAGLPGQPAPAESQDPGASTGSSV